MLMAIEFQNRNTPIRIDIQWHVLYAEIVVAVDSGFHVCAAYPLVYIKKI